MAKGHKPAPNNSPELTGDKPKSFGHKPGVLIRMERVIKAAPEQLHIGRAHTLQRHRLHLFFGCQHGFSENVSNLTTVPRNGQSCDR